MFSHLFCDPPMVLLDFDTLTLRIWKLGAHLDFMAHDDATKVWEML